MSAGSHRHSAGSLVGSNSGQIGDGCDVTMVHGPEELELYKAVTGISLEELQSGVEHIVEEDTVAETLDIRSILQDRKTRILLYALGRAGNIDGTNVEELSSLLCRIAARDLWQNHLVSMCVRRESSGERGGREEEIAPKTIWVVNDAEYHNLLPSDVWSRIAEFVVCHSNNADPAWNEYSNAEGLRGLLRMRAVCRDLCAAVSRVQKLILRNGNVTDEMLRTVSVVFPFVRELDISFAHSQREGGLTTAGFGHIAKMQRLERIYCDGARVKGRFLTAVCSIKGLKHLSLAHNDWVSDVHLAGLSSLTELKTLNCSYMSISDFALEHMQGLTGLHTLSLARSRLIRGGGFRWISGLTALTSMDLSGLSIAKGMESLGGLVNMKSLSLAHCARIDDAGMSHLSGMLQLEDLNLSHTFLGAEGLKNIRGMTRMKTLTLCYNDIISDECLTILGDLRCLTRLDLSCTAVTDNGLRAISGLTEMRVLALSFISSITDAGLDNIRSMKNMREIYLQETRISDAGVVGCLTTCMPLLECLDVSHNEAIGDATLEAMALLPNLRELDVSGTTVSDAGIQHLQHLGVLKSLKVQNSMVFGPGLRWLQSLPFLDELRIHLNKHHPDVLALRTALPHLKFHGEGAQAGS